VGDALRALIVEDDASTRGMLVEFLREEGFETFGAHDGAHAVRAAGARQPDVIVLDMGLPVLDASGFVEQWRTRSGAPDVPIVGISALPHGEVLARELGAAAFFPKPIDLDAFLASVRGLAARHAKRREGIDD
jgi:two-component system, OmpR family, KDP operon response regulator KdpE